MIEEYKKQIDKNNSKITELKNTIKSYYNKDVEVNIYSSDYNDVDTLKKVIQQQENSINDLNMIIDIEDNAVRTKIREQIENLKGSEPDKIFSKYYREGYIEINGIDVSVDNFYIKETENNNKSIFNFICTDERIDSRIFGTIDDKEYTLKNIYSFRDSKVFYQIYVDKKIFIDNKIKINNQQQLNEFINYIRSWTPEKHKMVAETVVGNMIK